MSGREPEGTAGGNDDATDPVRPEAAKPELDRRLQLLADVLTFQIKLTLDGLRDVLLVPVSLIAGIVGIVRGGDEPDLPFRQVLALGRRSERWINLFGQHDGNTADDLLQPMRKEAVSRVGQTVLRASRHVGRSPASVAVPAESASTEGPFAKSPASAAEASGAAPQDGKPSDTDDAPAR